MNYKETSSFFHYNPHTIGVTDLSNNGSVNNETKFLLIHLNDKNRSQLLKKLDANIYGYNFDIIAEILQNNDLSIDNYRYLYHIFVTMSFPKYIVLGHKSVTMKPNGYVRSLDYNNYTIWRPTDESGYHHIGLLCTVYNNSEPNNDIIEYGLVDVNYLIRLPVNDSVINQPLITANEFGSLMTPIDTLYTINRAKVTLNGRNLSFKLKDINQKFITPTGSNSQELEMNINDYIEKQYITYNTQSQLVMNDKCITNNSENNVSLSSSNAGTSPASLENCNLLHDNLNQQKWYQYDNKFISYANNKCLTSDNNQLLVKSCSDNSEWVKDKQEYFDPNDIYWNKFKGRTVVLVEADNPWFQNKNIESPQIYITPSPELNKVTLRNDADFDSKYLLDKTKYDLGLGHSYSSHPAIPCIEGFSPRHATNFSLKSLIRIIVILILVVIFSYVIYMRYL